jgi:hypothetical protein
VFEYYIDLPFLLGLYLGCCFTFGQTRGRRLFPGGSKSQSKRISEILKKVLAEHEDEVKGMGYDSVNDIGVHSIRKGAASFLASLPGGPPPAAICLRGGWTMGHVKDIYFHQMQSGDEFTGRCICLLNMMSSNFASSPAFFAKDTDEDWMKTNVGEVFPNFEATDGMGRILQMCLASLVHHRDEVLAFDPNHIARTCISIFRDPSKMQPVIEKVSVTHAWESNVHLSGIPPHVKGLVDLHALKVEQEKLAGTIYEKVMSGITEYFEARRIGGGDMTEARIKDMIASACQQNVEHLVERFEEKLSSLADTFDEAISGIPGRPIQERIINNPRRSRSARQPTFLLRTNPRGEISRLPNDFEFPKGGMYDCWVQWNVGHIERSIPPLRSLTPREFQFIDDMGKSESEKRCQRGPTKYRDKRRPSRKTYCDMKFLCNYIESKASSAGNDTTDRALGNVRKMFDLASKDLIIPGENNQRIDQFKWRTMVGRIRKKLKAQGGAG